MHRRWTHVPPALYSALALYAWISLTRTAHDGLTNLGLMLVTLPVTAVEIHLAVGVADSGSALRCLLSIGLALAVPDAWRATWAASVQTAKSEPTCSRPRLRPAQRSRPWPGRSSGEVIGIFN